MLKAVYVSKEHKKYRVSNGRKFLAPLVSLTVALMFMLSFAVSIFSVSSAKTVQAEDWTRWLMCSIFPEPAKQIYQVTQTDDLAFALRSKSTSTSGLDKVDYGLNWFLEVTGNDFKKVNESILGYSLDPSVVKKEENSAVPIVTGSAEKELSVAATNKGDKVNPFDRFGVAGLNWTGYQGEWKYFFIDACSGGAPIDLKAGMFYPERLEPMSGLEDVGKSSDVRTKQFSSYVTYPISRTIVDSVANFIFLITKSIVVLVIAFINFAFSDIVEILGISDLLSGNNGIFNALYKGVFQPLIILAFILTGAHLIWSGLIKRQFRQSLIVAVRSAVMYIVAVVISFAPAQVIQLPNKAVVGAQALILSTVNGSMTGGDDLCSTDIGIAKTNLTKDKHKEDKDFLAGISTNMKSVMGCKIWQFFLFKPWVQGQFGTDYNNLWANDKIPTWTKGGKSLGNANEKMVGNADVPLGDGSVLNNWALYQISAQTNAHATTGGDGTPVRTVNEVAPDWYRIVDALANYDEKEKTDIEQINADGSTQEVRYKVPKTENIPSPYFDTWVGNNNMSRISTSVSSLFVAVIGLSAPAVFAGLSAIYSVGLALLMAFSPLMLLMACWSRGWEVFKGWAEMVLNVMMMRIAFGFLLVFSILFISNILDMLSGQSWWKMIMMLIVFSVVVIKARPMIVKAFANFNFASFNMLGTAMSAVGKTRAVTKTPARFAQNAAIAGVTARRSGGSFFGGVGAGFKHEFENFTYKSRILSEGRESAQIHAAAIANSSPETREADPLRHNTNCVSCGKNLDYEIDNEGREIFEGGLTADGSLLCRECYEDGVDEKASHVRYNKLTDAALKEKQEMEQDVHKQRVVEAYRKCFRYENSYDETSLKELGENIAGFGTWVKTTSVSESEKDKRRSDLEAELQRQMAVVKLDIKKHKIAVRKSGNPETVTTAEIPSVIEPFVDKKSLQYAWGEGNYEYVLNMYVAGFVLWYQKESGEKYQTDLNETFAKIIDTDRNILN